MYFRTTFFFSYWYNFKTIDTTLKEKYNIIMTIDDQIRDEKLQYKLML